MAVPIPPSDLDERELKIWKALRWQISRDISTTKAFEGRIGVFDRGEMFFYLQPKTEEGGYKWVRYERVRNRMVIKRSEASSDLNGIFTDTVTQYCFPFSLTGLRKLATDILENIQDAD